MQILKREYRMAKISVRLYVCCFVVTAGKAGSLLYYM